MLTALRRLRSRCTGWFALFAAPLIFGLALLDDGGGDGGGDGGDGGAGGAGDAGQGNGDGGAGENKGDGKTFSQADVDRIVQERLARAKTKAPDDYDDLKTRAAKWDELEEKNKTELQREKDARAAAEKDRDQAKTTANSVLARSAVMVEASKAGADPDLVCAYLEANRGKDEFAVTVGDDGQVTGADAAVKAAIKAKPNLVGKTTSAGSADGGTRTGGADKPKTLEDAVAAALAK